MELLSVIFRGTFSYYVKPKGFISWIDTHVLLLMNFQYLVIIVSEIIQIIFPKWWGGGGITNNYFYVLLLENGRLFKVVGSVQKSPSFSKSRSKMSVMSSLKSVKSEKLPSIQTPL